MNGDKNHLQLFSSRIFHIPAVWIACISLIYFVAARLSLSLVFQPEGIAAIWPPSGIFLSAILLTQHSARPFLVVALFFTDFIAELLTGTPPFVSAVYALELSGDAVLSSWLLLRFVGEPITFRKVRDVFGFLVFAIIFSNGLLSSVAAAASTLISGTSFWSSWLWWATSTGIGNLLLTPFILSWASWAKTRLRVWNPKRVFESSVLFILLALLNFIIFKYLSQSYLFPLFLPYVTFPFLIWAALRFEVRGVTTALVIIAAIAISFVATGHTAILHYSGLSAIIILQLYLTIMAIPALFLAAVVANRKLTEEALRESEQKFKAITIQNPDHVLMQDKELRYLFVLNPQLGLTERDMIGKTDYDIIGGEEADKLTNVKKQVLTAGKTIHFETSLPSKSGKAEYFDGYYIPKYDTEGEVDGLYGYFRNVTEQKLAQRVLQESDERHRLILRTAMDGVWRVDKTGRLLEVNESYCRMSGYSEKELLAMSLFDLEAVESADQTADHMRKVVTDGEDRFESRHRRKDGTFLDVEVSVQYLPADGGSFVAFLQDITERKQKELQQRLTADVLRLLHETMDSEQIVRTLLVMIKDAAGVDAVGLRIRKGEDFPYYEQNGFSKEFLREENFLCARGGDGAILRGTDGRTILECTCGLVLSGRTDPALPFFTAHGSFWTNRSPELLALAPEDDPRTNARNRCIHSGYESVALITLRSGLETIGLLQLNAYAKDRFTLPQIEFYEGLCASIGVALKQRQTSDSLQALASHQQTLLAAIPDIVVEVNANKVYTWANQAGFDFFGEDVIGKEASYYFEGEQDTYDKVEPLFKGGEDTIRVESWQRRRDGEKRLLAWWCRTLKDKGGMVIGALSTARDITERKRTEEALRASEESYRTLAEAAHDIIALVDQDGRVTYANRFATELFGVSSQEFMGKRIDELFSPAIAARQWRNIQQVLQSGKALYVEAENVFPTKTIWLGTWLSPVPEANGNITAVLVIGRDITERKRAEETLASQAHQQEVVAELGQLALGGADLQMLFESAVAKAAETFGVEYCKVLELLPDGSALKLVAGVGWKEGLVGKATVGVDRDSQAGFTLLSNEPVIVEDLRTETRFSGPALLRDHGIVSGISSIIGDIKKPFGVLGAHTARRRVFNKDDVNFFRSVANVLAEAIERKRAEIEIQSLAKFPSENPNPVLRIAQDNRLIYANAAALSKLSEWDLQVGKSIPNELKIIVSQALSDVKMNPVDSRHQGRVYSLFVAPIADGNYTNIYGLDVTEIREKDRRINQQFEQLSALHAIDIAITGSVDLRLTLDIILKQVISHLAVDAALILLLNENSLFLEYWAGQGFITSALQHTRLYFGQGHAGRAVLEKRIVQVNLPEQIGDLERSPLLEREGFTTYFAVPLISKGRVKGVLEIFHRTSLIVEQEWMHFLNTLAVQAAIAIDNATLFNNLERSNIDLRLAYDKTLEGWSRALDLRDKETEGHSQRVTEMTVRLARANGMSDSEITHLRRGALLHDIGKMGIPDRILHKPDRLTNEEWKIMRMHPVYAYELLRPIEYLQPAIDIPYSHHEKWDGTGYPRGLQGEAIPVGGRLFAIVDVWDALSSDRPYRSAWPAEKVIEYIKEQSGRHFDPRVAEIFLGLLGHGKSVLVVDDEEEQRQLAVTMLTKLGYKVNTVVNGEEALEYLKKNQADIILLDMIMGSGIDGLETYQRIIDFRPGQKAIIVSGYLESERVREARRLGVGAYVSKPYTMENIDIAIRQELDRR